MHRLKHTKKPCLREVEPIEGGCVGNRRRTYVRS